jgi:hypothetical protein
MAVPTRVASTMWSRRPKVTGQFRWLTRSCMAAITTPSAPSRWTSLSSWSLASRRDSLTSSVQPATSALPDPQRAWRAVARSSCQDPIDMPSASPAGTQPVVISLAKSCPDRSEVNGSRRPYAAPGARTAVPMAVNSSPPSGNDPRDSRTPTTPCPPSWAHSVVIRSMAAWRAWYMACTSGPKDPGLPCPGTWIADGPGSPPPADPPAAGQLDPLADPAAYTAAPNTWPTGSKPALRIAANSPEVSEDPHRPLGRTCAVRASATAGNSSLTLPA